MEHINVEELPSFPSQVERSAEFAQLEVSFPSAIQG